MFVKYFLSICTVMSNGTRDMVYLYLPASRNLTRFVRSGSVQVKVYGGLVTNLGRSQDLHKVDTKQQG